MPCECAAITATRFELLKAKCAFRKTMMDCSTVIMLPSLPSSSAHNLGAVSMTRTNKDGVSSAYCGLVLEVRNVGSEIASICCTGWSCGTDLYTVFRLHVLGLLFRLQF